MKGSFARFAFRSLTFASTTWYHQKRFFHSQATPPASHFYQSQRNKNEINIKHHWYACQIMPIKESSQSQRTTDTVVYDLIDQRVYGCRHARRSMTKDNILRNSVGMFGCTHHSVLIASHRVLLRSIATVKKILYSTCRYETGDNGYGSLS